MAKIIHASQMLETPQINILNDNVIDSVNLNYNNSQLVEKPVSTFEVVVGQKNVLGNVDFLASNRIYNPNVYDVQIETLPSDNTSVEWDDVGFEGIIATQYNTYFSFRIDIDISDIPLIDLSSLFVKNNSIEANIVRNGYTIINSPVDDGTKVEKSDIMRIIAGIGNDFLTYEIIDINENIVTLKIRTLQYGNSTVFPTEVEGSVTKNTFVTIAKFDLYSKVVENKTIQIDNNSQVSLEANELITQDTKIDGVQISEYIANNIKSHYENGKATISMQVIDDGTEYDVNDIIQPMKTKEEFVTKIFEPVFSARTQIDIIFNYPILLFKQNNRFYVILSQAGIDNAVKIYSSVDGQTWKPENNNIISLIANISTSSSWKAWNANNKTFISCSSNNFSHLLYTNDGINYQLIYTFSTTGYADSVVYYKGYYYMKDTNGRIYRFVISDNINLELVGSFDFTYGSMAVFKDKLYIIGQTESNETMLVTSTDGVQFVTEILSFNGQYMTNAQSDDYLMFCAGNSTGAVIVTNDGSNWEKKESVWGSVIVYNKDVNAFITSIGGRTQITYDNGTTWSTLTANGGEFFEYNNNGNVFMNKGNLPYTFRFYSQGYDRVEYPLLTNQDGTPKTFEITSSELMFDGSSYYNIDAVEKVKQPLSLESVSVFWNIDMTSSQDSSYAFMEMNESELYPPYSIEQITSVDVSIQVSDKSALTGSMTYDEQLDEWEFIQYFGDTEYFVQCFLFKENGKYVFDAECYTDETLPITYNGGVTLNVQYYK